MDTMNVFGGDNTQVEGWKQKFTRRRNARTVLGRKLHKINKLGSNALEVNSKLKGKNVVGEIYTPYNFRRWVPAQFMACVLAAKSMPADENVILNNWRYRYHLEKIDGVCLQNAIDGKPAVRAASVLDVISGTPALAEAYKELKQVYRDGNEPWKDLLDDVTGKVFLELEAQGITVHDKTKDWYRVRYAIRKTLKTAYVKLNSGCYEIKKKQVDKYAKVVLNELFTLAEMETTPDASFTVRSELFPTELFKIAVVYHDSIDLTKQEFSSYGELANTLQKYMNEECIAYSTLNNTLKVSELFTLYFFRAGMYYTIKSILYNNNPNPTAEQLEKDKRILADILQNGFNEKVIMKYQQLLLSQDKFV